MGKHDPLIQVAFGPIDSKCETEFMTSYELIQDFHKIKTPIMQNQLLPLEAGPISYITSRFLYYFLAPKKGFVNGNDTSSILARCQYLLEKNDMQGALEQVNQLAGWSRLLADDWIQKMIQHVELMQAIQVVDTRLALKSLGVIQ
jgi:mitofilin